MSSDHDELVEHISSINSGLQAVLSIVNPTGDSTSGVEVQAIHMGSRLMRSIKRFREELMDPHKPPLGAVQLTGRWKTTVRESLEDLIVIREDGTETTLCHKSILEHHPHSDGDIVITIPLNQDKKAVKREEMIE